jgi:hypothetical protein
MLGTHWFSTPGSFCRLGVYLDLSPLALPNCAWLVLVNYDSKPPSSHHTAVLGASLIKQVKALDSLRLSGSPDQGVARHR